MNVSTLAKRLELLAQWRFGLFLLSEVRASKEQQKGLSRRADSLGCHILFSDPLLQFHLSEGVALMTRATFPMRRVRHPLLDPWSAIGRWLAAEVAIGTLNLTICVVYGFSKVHPQRHRNEVLCAEVFHWASGLSTPLILGGDFNESRTTATALNLAETWGLFHVSGSLITTRSKKSGLSTTEPLDHILVNAKIA